MAGIEDLDRLNRMVTNLYTAAFEKQPVGQNAVFKLSVTSREQVAVNEGDQPYMLGVASAGRAYTPLTTTNYSYSSGYSGTGRSSITAEFFKTSYTPDGFWVAARVVPYWTDSSPPSGQTHATLISYANVYCGYNFSTKAWEVNLYGQSTGPSVPTSYTTSGTVTDVRAAAYHSVSNTVLSLWVNNNPLVQVTLSGNLISTGSTVTIGNEPNSGYNRPLKAGIRVIAGGPPPPPSTEAADFPNSNLKQLSVYEVKERYVFDFMTQPNFSSSLLYGPCTFLWQGGWSGTINPNFYAPISDTEWQGDRYGECYVG